MECDTGTPNGCRVLASFNRLENHLTENPPLHFFAFELMFL
jgi:hypothetical protein